LQSTLATAADFIKQECSVALSFQPLGIFTCNDNNAAFRFSAEFKEKLSNALKGIKPPAHSAKKIPPRGQVRAGAKRQHHTADQITNTTFPLIAGPRKARLPSQIFRQRSPSNPPRGLIGGRLLRCGQGRFRLATQSRALPRSFFKGGIPGIRKKGRGRTPLISAAREPPRSHPREDPHPSAFQVRPDEAQGG